MPKVTDRNLFVIGDEEILFDPAKILLSESIAMERATGLSWPQIVAGINNGVMVATQAAVWVMRKRSNPRLKLSEVVFNTGDYMLVDPDVHPDYLILEPGEELPGSEPEVPDAGEYPTDEPTAPKDRPQDATGS